MFLIAFPLLLIPFALYNMVAFLLNMPFGDTLFSIPLPSHTRMAVSLGDALVVLSILLLYVEFLKAARFRSKAVMDHVLALVLFIGMACEFALVPKAQTAPFLFLTTLALLDLLTALSVGAAERAPVIEAEHHDPAAV
jgi:uncharacterized membrane protein YobD (UPF0266 family)